MPIYITHTMNVFGERQHPEKFIPMTIKKVKNVVAGNADILLVPNVEAGNALVKMMVYFMGACAAGVVLGGKAPVVITSRSDESEARLASIAASIVALG